MNPIMLRDSEFGAVRLRAFGTYVIRIKDPGTVIRQIVGTDGHFTVEEIVNQLRNFIVSRFAEIVGQQKIPVLDLAANYGELGGFLTQKIAPDFGALGLELTQLLVENISLPPAVEEALDRAIDSIASAPLPRLTGTRQPGQKSLAQLFAESPFKGLGIDFERFPDTWPPDEL